MRGVPPKSVSSLLGSFFLCFVCVLFFVVCVYCLLFCLVVFGGVVGGWVVLVFGVSFSGFCYNCFINQGRKDITMQYTPRALATVATEAVQCYIDTARPCDRELVARVWADLAHEIVFDPFSGRVRRARDASYWNSILSDVERDFGSWLELHGMYGSLVEYVGYAVLDSCLSFVGLERRREPKEV